MNSLNIVQWVLRIGACGTFLGHGILAIGINPMWIGYLTTVGFTHESAVSIMPIIGMIDIVVATAFLIRPVKSLIIYAIIWAFLTALIRPISGESILAFVERAANWAAPLALYLLLYKNNATEE